MSKKSKQKDGLLKEEDIFKAVLVADTFDENFGPLTATLPKALFPVASIPLIEYSLELLDSSEVEEVFILSCFHSQQLKSYINSSKWAKGKMKIIVIVLDSCISFGDCLRELDTKALIRNNFVLLSADNVSNIPLKPILNNLRNTLMTDKGCVMQLIMKKVAVGSIPAEEEVMVVNASKTNKIVHYQRIMNNQRLQLPVSVIQENPSVDIHCDLVNTQMAICSPTVLPLFSDNFDFQTFDDFIKGILINEEILGNSIYLHPATADYVAKISNIQMYSSVIHDILGRWPYPLVPDLMASMSYRRHNIYKCKSVTLARGSVIKENVVLAQNTTVGEDTKISHSVIGKACKIGSNVTIEDSFVWDNVTIEDGCCISRSLLADGVIVKKSSNVSGGSILGQDVIVGPNHELPEGTLLIKEEKKDEFSNSNEKASECDKTVVGNEGLGYVYKVDANDDEEDAALALGLRNLNLQPIKVEYDLDSSSTSSEFSIQDGDLSENEERSETPQHEDVKLFCGEVYDSLVGGFQEHVKCDNLILEINSSKYAYNVTMKEVNMNISSIILALPLDNNSNLSVGDYFKSLHLYLTYFTPLLKNYIKSEESQLDCLFAIESFAFKNLEMVNATTKILHYLYENEVLGEEAIIAWFDLEPQGVKDEEHVKLRNTVSNFVNWLQEAEEETDSEDSD